MQKLLLEKPSYIAQNVKNRIFSYIPYSKANKNWMEYIYYFFTTIIMIFLISRIYAILMVSPDDVVYENIISGFATGTPSGLCWFIKYPLAAILALLYRIIPQLNWYELFLMSCHILCYFLIFCRGKYFKKKDKVAYVLGAITVFLLLTVEYTVNLEWSTTAGLLGATALFRYTTIPIKKKNTSNIKEYAICFSLLILGFCIRDSIIITFIPLAFLSWLKHSHDIKSIFKNKKEQKRKLLINLDFVFVAAWFVLMIMFIHSLAYSSLEWKEYKSYTKDRSTLLDYYGYPSYSENEDVYTNAGISKEMQYLMTYDYNYLLAFEQTDNIDLSSLAEASTSKHNQKTFYEKCIYIYQKIESLFSSNRFLIPAFLLVISICFLIYKIGHAKKIEQIYWIGLLIWLVFVLVYIASRGRLPIRIGINLVFGFCAIMLGEFVKNIWNYHSNKESILKECFSIIQNKYQKYVVIITLFILIAINMFDIYIDNEKNAELAIAKNQIIEYCKKNPDGVYLRDFTSFSQRGNLFCKSTNSSNYISTGGWIYNTPVYDSMLELNGIVDGITASVKEGKEIYYLVYEYRTNDTCARINNYFNSMGKELRAQEADRFSTVRENVIVLQFKVQQN